MAEKRKLMKPLLAYSFVIVLVVIVVIIIWLCWFQPVTTVLLVRHAEKATEGVDSPLSVEGQERAQALIHVVGEAGITAIYATQFIRTQQTVQPLADHLNLSVNQVDANDIEGIVNHVISEHSG